MVFAKQLRQHVKRGRIRCSVRVWMTPRVKAGGRYAMEDGSIVVDSIEQIRMKDITHDLARESGFENVDALMNIARHGRGENIYLVRFRYLPPGAWDGTVRRMEKVDEAFDPRCHVSYRRTRSVSGPGRGTGRGDPRHRR
ncbi:MAG TPA: hypothetical protein VFV51_07200 [Vicinamibacterales bacterium]|nr:hypothetical protein [Vicinamibacterales bacterium]